MTSSSPNATLTRLLELLQTLFVSDRDAALSLLGQLGSMAVAFYIARYKVRSRVAILLVAALGGVGAMVASVLADGQGACFILLATPIIYFAAVSGRRDLRIFKDDPIQPRRRDDAKDGREGNAGD